MGAPGTYHVVPDNVGCARDWICDDQFSWISNLYLCAGSGAVLGRERRIYNLRNIP